MGIRLLVIVLLVQMVAARISIDIDVDKNKEVKVSHNGRETRVVTDDDIDAFKIKAHNLVTGLKEYMGRRPSDLFVRSPTPWGDLYKRHNWEQVQRVLAVRSARVKRFSSVPVVVMAQDAENSSGRTIKVNAGISHTVENTITTSWSNEYQLGFSQDVNYQINFEMASVGGTTGFSRSNTWGKSEERTITETIGTTSSVEVELQPGQAIIAILMAKVGKIEIEVEHEAYLKGDVALNYYPTYNGHYFYSCSISDIPTTGGNMNRITTTETIKMNVYMEVKLRVYDKNTGVFLYQKLF